jgi:hypothetical protein
MAESSEFVDVDKAFRSSLLVVDGEITERFGCVQILALPSQLAQEDLNKRLRV